MAYKIDLHTHSIISPDGGINRVEYEKLLNDKLDVIAITDHNTIDFAKKMHALFGNKIIIGEEITTKDGEILGLFLEKAIKPGMSASVTAKEIKEQGGIVCIPHPFEVFRRGVQQEVLKEMVSLIDTIEVFNGRGKWRGKSDEAAVFAKTNKIVGVANSDAHGFFGAGETYTTIAELPTAKTIVGLLSKGSINSVYAPLWTFLYPSMNRIKNMYR